MTKTYYSSISEAKRRQYKYCVDWFQGTWVSNDLHGLFDFFAQFGLDPEGWAPSIFRPSGIRNYSNILCYDGKHSLILAYNVERHGLVDLNCNNKGIYFSFSGDGLRFLGDDCFRQLIFKLSEDDLFRPSRIDLALDIFDRDNPIIDLFLDAARRTKYDMKEKGKPFFHALHLKTCSSDFILYPNVDSDGLPYSNFAFKNHKAKSVALRIYNKYEETLTGRLSRFYTENFTKYYEAVFREAAPPEIPNDKTILEVVAPTGYWWRIEQEFHFRHAMRCWDAMVGISSRDRETLKVLSRSSGDDFSVQAVFTSTLSSVFSICEARSSYTNVSYASLFDEYADFLFFISRSIYLPKLVYLPHIAVDLTRLKNFAFKNAINFKAFLQLYDVDVGFRELFFDRLQYLNDKNNVFRKYAPLRAEFKRAYGKDLDLLRDYTQITCI